jgi:dTDP-4-amino-4,6-dideoxygalactose transaminase
MHQLLKKGYPMKIDEIPCKGQKNMPAFSRVERMFKTIFDNRYYTNHGPFAQDLEKKLQEFLNVKHVMAMTNESIALIIAAKSLELCGKVLCSEFTSASALNSLIWAGLEPIICTANQDILCLDLKSLEDKIEDGISGILASHVQPNLCDVNALEHFAQEKSLKLYFDSSTSFGSLYKTRKIGGFGELEVFSFHEDEIINAAEGAIVSTNNDELAKKIRNIRSSYGSGPLVKVPITGNGRMSEAQASLALLSLADYEKNISRNSIQFKAYENRLNSQDNIEIIKPELGVDTNFSSV